MTPVMVDSDNGGGAAGGPAAAQHQTAAGAAGPPGEGAVFGLVQRQAPPRLLLAGEVDAANLITIRKLKKKKKV